MDQGDGGGGEVDLTVNGFTDSSITDAHQYTTTRDKEGDGGGGIWRKKYHQSDFLLISG